MKNLAALWIRDGVLLNRMPLNTLAFAWSYALHDSSKQEMQISDLVNFAFEQSGYSCLEKLTLLQDRLGTNIDLLAAEAFYNDVVTALGPKVPYAPGAIETLEWVKDRAANFITSAIRQEILDQWSFSTQGLSIAPYLSEILGQRVNQNGSVFSKGEGHFHYVYDTLLKTGAAPKLYFFADAVSEVKMGRQFASMFSITPVGFATEIAADQFKQTSLALGHLLKDNAKFQSSQANLSLALNCLVLPDLESMEANLLRAGADYVVRDFASLKSTFRC